MSAERAGSETGGGRERAPLLLLLLLLLLALAFSCFWFSFDSTETRASDSLRRASTAAATACEEKKRGLWR